MAASSFSFSSSFSVFVMFVAIVLIMESNSASAHHLSETFYSKSCPKVFSAVKSVVRAAVSKEKRMGASLLRLFFHDCFVNGCDGSILLDDASFRGEKTAGPNLFSVRGFNVVDFIKAKVEKVCPGVVSCADILAIASRDSVVLLGGPDWDVKLGRRDSKTASFHTANRTGVLPSPFSTLSQLINRFEAVGLSAKDMVALSGAHTIGKARCSSFRQRIHKEPNIDRSFAKKRQSSCPKTSGLGDTNLAPLDVGTPNSFDSKYFQNLVNKKGLLHSDQVLFSGGPTDSLVKKYSSDVKEFRSDFVKAMIKMGDISPLTGSNGEIRKHCRRPN